MDHTHKEPGRSLAHVAIGQCNKKGTEEKDGRRHRVLCSFADLASHQPEAEAHRARSQVGIFYVIINVSAIKSQQRPFPIVKTGTSRTSHFF